MLATARPYALLPALLLCLCAAGTALATPRQDLDRLADKLLSSLPDDKPTLAILPLEGEEGKAISEYLVANVQASGVATLVERAQFQKLLQEQALSLSGAVSDSAAVQAGKALSVRYLMTGSVAKVLGTQRVNLRLVEVETGKILQAGSFSAKGEEFAGLPRELLGEESKVSSTVFRSAVMPGWGQFYSDRPVRGGLWLGAFAASTGFMAYSFVKAADFEDQKVALELQRSTNSGLLKLGKDFNDETGLTRTDNTFQFNAWYSAKLNGIKSKEGDASRRGKIALGLMGGVYLANLADAAWCGSQRKRTFDLYFSGTLQNPAATVAVAW
jgi:TolB-like protein